MKPGKSDVFGTACKINESIHMSHTDNCPKQSQTMTVSLFEWMQTIDLTHLTFYAEHFRPLPQNAVKVKLLFTFAIFKQIDLVSASEATKVLFVYHSSTDSQQGYWLENYFHLMATKNMMVHPISLKNLQESMLQIMCSRTRGCTRTDKTWPDHTSTQTRTTPVNWQGQPTGCVTEMPCRHCVSMGESSAFHPNIQLICPRSMFCPSRVYLLFRICKPIHAEQNNKLKPDWREN